ncbi:hypothetical protein [Streptomyces sp. NPDC001153]
MVRHHPRTETMWCSFLAVLVLAASACSSQDRATSPKTVRKLAGSSEAVRARQAEEKHLRDVVRAYAEQNPLTLGLVDVRDECFGGTARQWIDSNGDDQYKIKCSLSVTAYYGADRKHFVSVLDGILAAGDRPGSGVPFNHSSDGQIIHYYRQHGGQEQEPEAPQLSSASHTLSWDPVRDRNRSYLMVTEPDKCRASDPPVARCLREPESGTVAAIRSQYGMVFKLDLGHSDYFTMYKDGRTRRN